ncbi:MAG: non-homologous end-joining DNA ligase [Bacillota bacterium]
MAVTKAMVQVHGRILGVSNLDKVLWEEDGLTKGDLIDYFLRVSGYILPHLRDRPLSLRRFPSGIDGKCFYQKNRMRGSPPWVEGYLHHGSGADIDFVLAQEPATLAWLGDQACIEVHPWLSRRHAPEAPDFAVLDLDPDPPSGFREAVEVARVLKDALAHLGLMGFPKTSGAKGLHIYVPLAPGRYGHRDAVDLCLFLAGLVARSMPDRATLERKVTNRQGRIYIDCYQNGMGKTVVAPYSPRPLRGAPVSAPVTWEELASVEPGAFHLKNMAGRLGERGDLFRAVLDTGQPVDDALALARRKKGR